MVGGLFDVFICCCIIEERKRGIGEGFSKELEICLWDGDCLREYFDQDYFGVLLYVEVEFGLFCEGEGQFYFIYLIFL